MPKDSKAQKARKATEKIADKNAVPGSRNTKRLRDKTSDAMRKLGL